MVEIALQTVLGARADRTIKRIANQIALAGVLGMIAVSLLTAFDIVVMRWLINRPIAGSNEFLSTIFAVSVTAVLPGVLASRAGLEIDILGDHLRPSVVSFLRQLGQALLLVLVVLIAWRIAVYAHHAYVRGQSTIILQWRTWPFLSLISLIFLFCVPVQLFTFLGAVRESAGQYSVGWRAALLIALPSAFMFVVFLVGDDLFLYFSAHPIGLSLAIFILLWVLVLLMIPVAAVLVTCGFVGTVLLMGTGAALNVLGSETAGLLTNTDLAVVPLFLLMGGFATAGGLSNDIYRLAHAAFGFLRGGLAHATVGGCAGFGALTGSSLATVATMGRVAMPEMRERGYAASLASGCIVAGGTLGQLVPPSTAIVVYALLTEESIGELYIAVLIPALMTVLFYMAAIAITVHWRPEMAPSKDRFNLREFLAALKNASIVLGMFALVIGGIYAGIFTATEAAAIGAAIAFFVALFRGKLKKATVLGVVAETTAATGIVYFVIIGAFITTFFVGSAGLPSYLTESLINSGLAPLTIIILLVLFYIVLGCVMDSFTVMIITAPLVAVVIAKIGYDVTWWGIMMVILVELGVVTPPFGMNLFVMKTVEPTLPLKTIFAGTLPFVVADLIKIALLILFPWIVLWLPRTAFH
jgi:tripartite ATP-independent transporter DctM subunit